MKNCINTRGGNNKLTNNNWFKDIREESGLTQNEIAEKVGITRQHIGAIENGLAKPSPSVAKKIAETLKFDWTRFYEEEKEEV